MATKGVLLEAIRKLEYNNMKLRQKFSSADDKRKKEILSQIARNDSMILDFNYQLTNE
jgi:hypothetical protein